MAAFLETVDTLLYGRVAYELMLDHWPQTGEDQSITEKDRAFAQNERSP
jgi:hypothetical protein